MGRYHLMAMRYHAGYCEVEGKVPVAEMRSD